jgi:SAM-dependent methyltransferase
VSAVGESGTLAAQSAQAAWNSSEWAAAKHVDIYDNRVLTPVEVQIFVRYREDLSGRVLDIGCGAGRVLAYLVMLGAEAYGVDLAPAMVEYCRRTVPEAHVSVGNAAALADSVTGPFDVVIAPDNLIDVFDDGERRRVLSGIRDVLAPDGLFIFSSHDLGWLEENPGPREWEQPTAAQSLQKLLDASPARLIQAARNRREIARNRKRLAPLEKRHADHAIVNDFPHNYSLLHYYIRRDDQERQLSETGFALVECLAADGRAVGPGGWGTTDSLHYVARAV